MVVSMRITVVVLIVIGHCMYDCCRYSRGQYGDEAKRSNRYMKSGYGPSISSGPVCMTWN